MSTAQGSGESFAINRSSRGGPGGCGRGTKCILLKHGMAAVRLLWVAELHGSRDRIAGVVCAADRQI